LIYPTLRSRWATAFMRFFFRLLYHEFAWSYDLVAAVVSLGRWNEWVASALPFLHGPRILEIGHGPGHLQLALHERGFLPVGLDESHQMGRQARRRIKTRGYRPLLIRGKANDLPLTSSSFDQVVATFPSEFIFQPATLDEIRRVLLPSGELIVLPAAWITGASFLERMAAALSRITGQTPEWENLEGFEETLASHFQKAGLHPQFHLERLDSSALLFIRVVKGE
jgi:ubiquinone/menaquinone biosynthesis C-methylase UbiE